MRRRFTGPGHSPTALPGEVHKPAQDFPLPVGLARRGSRRPGGRRGFPGRGTRVSPVVFLPEATHGQVEDLRYHFHGIESFAGIAKAKLTIRGR